ncbi:MAG: hypothetical protein MR051_06740 [Lentisphaeria bacterium]|nr:hypothetical protein [Lentisphaeria bacterium]
MLKKLGAVWALTAGLLSAAYDVNFFPTLAVNTADQVRFVMPERGIGLSRVRRVERNQPFTLSISIRLREQTDRPLKLIGTIAAKKPDGTAGTGVPETELFDLPAGAKGVFFAKIEVRGVFEPSDPTGDWEWTLTLRDAGDPAGTVRTATAGIQLADSISDARPMDRAELNRFLTNYYRNPRPERLMAALKFFLGDGDAELRKRKNFNPNPVIHGLAEAFRLNPQFHDDLAAATAGLTERQQLFMALIFAELGKDAVMAQKEVIDPQVQVMIGQFAGKNPLAFSEVKNPVHLDMLWMEFFITGKFEPVRRLAAELRKRPGISLADGTAKIKAKQPLTPEEKRQMGEQLIQFSADWSLTFHLRQGHRLAGFYLETIFRRKLLPDPYVLGRLVGILTKAGTTQRKGK